MIHFLYQTPFKLKQITRIKKLLKTIALNEKRTIQSISIILTNDDFLLEMNKKFLAHDYYTDIITFDYTDKPDQLYGELYISIDMAQHNAKEYNVPVHNELLRLIIHGTLHLLGYNDKSPTEKKIMTDKENLYLSIY